MRRTFTQLLSAVLACTLTVGAGPAAQAAPDGGETDRQQGVVADQRYGLLSEPDLAELEAENPAPRAEVRAGVRQLPDAAPQAEVYPRPADGTYDVLGGGFGHRIGMSQYGADGAGQAGLSYRQILDFYYPGTDLVTRNLNQIDIGITRDNDGVTRINHRSGLRVSAGPGAQTYALPARQQWRVRATSSSASSCVLESYNGSRWRTEWPSGMSRRCPVTFSSPSEGTVDLYLADGSLRVYRGAVTATHVGTPRVVSVNRLPVQQYLRSVVNAEMPSSFHTQALRSQAVAARTYAARGSNGTSYYDTCDTTACQAYPGRGVRRSNGSLLTLEHPNADAAVSATDDRVLTYDFPAGTALATTLYSSSNGGWAAAAGNGHDYMPAHVDPYDDVAGNSRHSWRAQLPVTSLEARYGIHRVERVQILTRDGDGLWGGRVLTARVEGFTAGGDYTVAPASGIGLYLARPWPTYSGGLSSDYYTFTGASQDPGVERIGGTNRWDTAAKAARKWSPGVGVVYVAGGEDYPDALTAAARTGIYDAPVLLTKVDQIPSATRGALNRLDPARIVVVGGTGSVSLSVRRELERYAGTGRVDLVAGDDRYGTAAEMASYYPSGVPRVYLASGENYADALAGAARAADEQTPVLLTRPDRLDDATRSQLARLDPTEIVVLGGTKSIQDSVAEQAARYATSGRFERVGGANRYRTAELIARRLPASTGQAYLASGLTFPDALVGAGLAGQHGAPLLLTKPDRIPTQTQRALSRLDLQAAAVLGGRATIHNSVLDAVRGYLD